MNEELQVPPQSIPAGEEVTIPLPALLTVRMKLCKVKLALALFAASIVTVQAPVPVQAPLQPVKVEPVAGVAVSVTAVVYPKVPLQVLPQLMPAGVLATVPVPVPAGLTVSVNVWSVKLAVTLWGVVMVTVQGPVPVQSPLQPIKVEPVDAVAVSVTAVP